MANSKASFTTKLSLFHQELWYYHIPVSKEIAESLIEGKDRRVLCTLNEKITFPCALMHRGDGTYFININKENRKKFNIGEGETLHVSIEKDNSKYGMPMPEEMSALLEMDDEGREYFDKLTPGKQRSLLFIVGKPKNADTRLRKALVIVDYLKATKGRLDFKELNQAFKDSNQR